VAPSGALVSSARAQASTIGSLSTYTIRESGAMSWATWWVFCAVGRPVPKVKKLPDPGRRGQVAHRASQEGPVGPHARHDGRVGRDHR
jgi:hypothetical protein